MGVLSLGWKLKERPKEQASYHQHHGQIPTLTSRGLHFPPFHCASAAQPRPRPMTLPRSLVLYTNEERQRTITGRTSGVPGGERVQGSFTWNAELAITITVHIKHIKGKTHLQSTCFLV